MLVKRMNAVLAICTVLTSLSHSFLLCLSVFFQVNVIPLAKPFGTAAKICLGLHFVLSLVIFFIVNDGSNFIRYTKENKELLMQRISAIALCILVVIHMDLQSTVLGIATASMGTVIYVIAIEFFQAFALDMHINASLSKALITLGILKTDKQKMVFDVISRPIVLIIVMASFAAFVTMIINLRGVA